MSLLSTFATNSINILAGINGSEASQALIIACSVAANDLLYLPWPRAVRLALPLHVTGAGALDVGGPWAAGMAHGSAELVHRHLFSLYFMLPLIGATAGFLFHNWCPFFPLPTPFCAGS
jgi:UDP-N-acetylglucosamine--dolichyl-phosphate N-acetylglucosaminephosphotransferase